MRFIPIQKLDVGMTVADDVYDADCKIILLRGDKLSPRNLRTLSEQEYRGIYVEDDISRDIHVEYPISYALKKDLIYAVRDGDVDKCKSLSQFVVKELRAKPKLQINMISVYPASMYKNVHAVDVAVYSCMVGMTMRIPLNHLFLLVNAALIRDIGEISIPSDILEKKGRLTLEEYHIVKAHPTLSYQMIKDRRDLSDFEKDAVLKHHENFDGSGYPNGCMGNDIPMLARIIHAVDVMDALLAERSYKKAYTFMEAAQYLLGASGILFDRDVVKALLSHLPIYPRGTEVLLSEGGKAIVIKNVDGNRLRPMVRTEGGSVVDLSESSFSHITIRSIIGDEDLSEVELEESRNRTIKATRTHRILAVDDLKTNLIVLKDILDKDYSLSLVKSGKVAIKFLETHPMPDLIILDIDMPEMNGIETARRIQRMTMGAVPILFVTTHCDRETVLTCRSLQCAGYIIRPYNEVFIKSEIKRILTGIEEVR